MVIFLTWVNVQTVSGAGERGSRLNAPWSSPVEVPSGDTWRGCTRGEEKADATVYCVGRGGGGSTNEAYIMYYESAQRK
jgi:hypothetical protein